MQKFKKKERLCSSKLIEELSKNGRSFLIYPFKVIWLTKDYEDQFPAKVMFAVSKKKHKKAVSRNKIKRLIRESYRKNKEKLIYEFLRNKNQKCLLMFIYLSEEIMEYKQIEKKIKSVLIRLQKEINNNAEN